MAQIERYLNELGVQTTILESDRETPEKALLSQTDLLLFDFGLFEANPALIAQVATNLVMKNLPKIVIASKRQEIHAPQNWQKVEVLQGLFTRRDVWALVKRFTPRGTTSLIHHATLFVRPVKVVEERNGTILIADDNEVSLRILADYMTNCGYQVVLAYNGAEAVERARELVPKMVLMDIQMPGMDGIEAIRRIRSTPSIAQVPVIALTALAMPNDRERCMAAGADDYLSKPISLKSLVNLVDQYIGYRQIQKKGSN